MVSKKVFTKMDLQWSFNNVQIKEEDKWKATFTMHIGLFEPTVMFFGLTSLPATFQAIMNKILRDLINQEDIVAFVNDILIGTESEEEHDTIVKEVLKRLEKNNLYVKPEKYMWKVRKVGFLEVIIGPNRIKIKKKVEGVLNWPTQKNIKETRKFLGLANYYRRFVKDFAKIMRPINILTRKDIKQQWVNNQQVALKELKKISTTKPVLTKSHLDREFRVEAGISNYATGEVLLIKYMDNL